MKSIQAGEHPAYDPILGTADAAQYLGVHPETLKKWARLRQIASVRNSANPRGSEVRFRLSALNAWVKAHEIEEAKRIVAINEESISLQKNLIQALEDRVLELESRLPGI